MRFHRSGPVQRPRVGWGRSTALATRGVATLAATLLGVTLVPAALLASSAQGAQAAVAPVAPVGQGFTVTPSDLAFILKQIKIAERHAATLTVANPCGTLVGRGPDRIPDALTSYGLRTVDGSCNNLIAGRETFAAADQTFPRLTTGRWKDAEAITPDFPVGAPGPTSYQQKKGSVVDSAPRVISNLIDDQTSANPAAVAAAGSPVRTQGNPGLHPCTTDPQGDAVPPVVGAPAGCVPSHQTLFIPNVTTDVGLSPPYNSLFTFFGQFFDHGVDQTVKGGGTVFVPLKADDPLIAGPDHVLGTVDDLPPHLRFMVLTRAQNQPGPDGKLGTADDVQDANNTDSPWVDQSQTYTSHASHQVFLREYEKSSAGNPVSTGRLLGGLSGNGATGMATWASVKKQAADLLGLLLVDTDVTSVPMIAADPYGKFLPGPARGLPQYVTRAGLVEGDTAHPVSVPADVLHFDTPFLTDIAHNADPSPADLDHNPATPPTAPMPDADIVASADFAKQLPGTYDDEMLDAHFACGDGRCNENIALTTIHQVFHSEHDRLVADIMNTLTQDTSATGVAALAQWQRATGAAGWNGERLFQAARFVAEMEYQHMVFEEFARKVAPAIQPFHVYHPDINPAIHAEFAHAVYRFGHSMLDETVARTNADGSDNSVPLLAAFLNPPEYFNGGTAGALTPAQAAGSVVMGSSNQVGNELDEFVTETLRNNLLGLPLDLATLNLTRAREAGIAPLNGVRRQLFEATNDGQLRPYTSWSDFGQHLKHPESLINFVAAYGKHPSVSGASTLAGKRAAAKLLVDPTTPGDPAISADAAEFMLGTGAWASTAAGVTTTGVDDVDLWVGGLAEITNLNGGLLGSTFNYVFENQLTDLQNGDRFYYLPRTAGMNLRSQLEGNSFAEIIQRNTEGTSSLKADAFATADCKFQLKNLAGTAGGFASFGSTVADDTTTTDCDESRLLKRNPPDGTIQYRQVNTVDRSGVNGQSVYNGTTGTDRVWGGNDNDTFWGGAGNDVIEGGGGDDVALGGEGDDIVTDSSGADVLKGGPGDDALDAGIGNDIVLGGDGQDVTNGGANDNETFGGPGSDFIIAGQGADVVFGGGGDDWIEGGTGQDLLQGDHGAPFFDDPAQVKPGNDIMIGQAGENDYDAEGGDDIMSANAAIDRYAGIAGFDWVTHQFDTVGADDDMNINANLLGLPLPAVVNRDRWQETEAVSGSAFNDVIRGDNIVPRTTGGAGFTGCDVLDQAGVDRIQGLAALLPPLTKALAPVVALSGTGFCPLSGPVWGEGNILLGGAGSDTIEGRGGDDIIDGDAALTVAISVRIDPADPATEIGRTDLMEHQYRRDSSGALTGPTLQAAVFAGTVDPGNLVAVREITYPKAGTDTNSVDTAVFADFQDNYTVTTVPAGARMGSPGSVTTVVDNRGGANSGTDTLRSVENLAFYDTVAPGAPVAVKAVAGDRTATVSWTAPGQLVTTFTVEVTDTNSNMVVKNVTAQGGATSVEVPGLSNGTPYSFRVMASNSIGAGPFSPSSNVATPAVSAVVTPPAGNPPVVAPPAVTPPAVTPSAGNPPAVTPPAVTPSAGNPPVVTPPAGTPPVSTPGSGGASTGSPAAPRVLLTSTLRAPLAGLHSLTALTGTVAPFRGVTLALTQRSGAGAFRTVATKRISATATNGRFSFRLPTSTSGRVSYRAVVTGPGLRATSGPIRTLAVFAAKVVAVSPKGREFVSVRNTGTVLLPLVGMRLQDVSGQSLILPSRALKPGETLRVFTGSGRPAAGRLFLGRRANVWGAHDTARLVDRSGTAVASLRY